MRAFHFDLRHLPDDAGLHVAVGERLIPLMAHGDRTLAASAATNPTLSFLGTAARRFTHYAALDGAEPPPGAVTLVRLLAPAAKGVHLSPCLMMLSHIPEGALRVFHRGQFRRYGRGGGRRLGLFERGEAADGVPGAYSGKLHALGLTELPADDDEAMGLLLGTATLVTTLDTAAALVALHPNLASVQPATGAVVLHDHVLPDPRLKPAQYNAMQGLSDAITAAGQNWAPVIECTDHAGNPLQAGYALGDPDKGGIAAGQQLYTYGLDERVQDKLPGPLGGANRTAAADSRLSGKTWSPDRGTASVVRDNDVPSAAGARDDAPAYKWTVNEITKHYGAYVVKDSLTLKSGDKLSIEANNSNLRTFYVDYQLKDAAGKDSGNAKDLRTLNATNTILGIPMPTMATVLEIDLEDAPQVELRFGSLGTSDWTSSCARGALATGFFQYGIPIFMMTIGRSLFSTKSLNELLRDMDLMDTFFTIVVPIVGGAVYVVNDPLRAGQKLIFALANAAISIGLQRGMEKLGQWMMDQAAAAAVASAFGPYGLALRVAAVLMNGEQMIVTTTQVLSSPATSRVVVSRAIDVKLTLRPDPAHGEVGNPKSAVWPAVATRYEVILQPKGGTALVKKGDMPATTSGDPIPITFEDIPAAANFQITASFYSATGWLAGSWQCGWTKAEPNRGTTLDLGDKTITEKLVPLAPDTQYVYKESMGYDPAAGFGWQVGQPATATVAALNCGDDGRLCELVGMSFNNSAFQVGYAWRASGQNLRPDAASAPPSGKQLYAVQNLSVLARPQSRLITTDIGFTNRPQIGYAPAFEPGSEIDQDNFVLDPRGGGMHLRQVVLMNKDTDQPRDFGFGQADQPSWGYFPVQNIDALAVHPNRLVIGASFQNHKLMILTLPAEGTSDAEAPQALVMSGDGVREGLMRGPKALAVAPDGRILILESVNKRVQAFDTKGNPVPSFTWQAPAFSLATAAVATDLDAGRVPAAFADALVDSAATYLCDLDSAFAAQLDRATFAAEDDPLLAALSDNGISLSFDGNSLADPTVSARIAVITPGKAWVITDPRGYAYRLVAAAAIEVFAVPALPTVKTVTKGASWLLTDTLLGLSWQFSPSTATSGQTLVQASTSYFPLKNLPAAVTFLDMAVEAQGHIYVLMYANDGSRTTDYMLDIYGPDGTFLSRTPDPKVTRTPQNLVAGKIAVDMWRNLFALGFGAIKGPGGAVQPSLSHWPPTTPLFTLDKCYQADLNNLNITVIQEAFAGKGFILSGKTFITVLDREGAWQVKDGDTVYHVYRCGSELQVYSVPA